jgi:hypothetical protein
MFQFDDTSKNRGSKPDVMRHMRMVMTHSPAAQPDPVAAWPLVVRATGVIAVITTIAVWALSRFTGIGQELLLAGAVAGAFVAGCRLPAAAPWFLRPVPSDPDDAAID